MGETALVETSESAPPACKPKYKRLTAADRAYALKLRDQNFTQAQIAQRLGCTQQTVSEWLSHCTDTTAQASTYLRGQALPMAEKIAKKGKPADLIKVLQGVNVLAEERSAGLTIQIGVKDSDVSITLAPPPVVVGSHLPEVSEKSLRIRAGSDNPSSVNQD